MTSARLDGIGKTTLIRINAVYDHIFGILERNGNPAKLPGTHLSLEISNSLGRFSPTSSILSEQRTHSAQTKRHSQVHRLCVTEFLGASARLRWHEQRIANGGLSPTPCIDSLNSEKPHGQQETVRCSLRPRGACLFSCRSLPRSKLLSEVVVARRLCTPDLRRVGMATPTLSRTGCAGTLEPLPDMTGRTSRPR